MSIATCSDCGSLVDCDDDPACFVPVANHDIVVCETCRVVRAIADGDIEAETEAVGA